MPRCLRAFLPDFLLFFLFFLIFPPAAQGAESACLLSEPIGIVQLKHKGQSHWEMVHTESASAAIGDEIRTGYGASARVSCAGGILDLEANAAIALEQATPKEVAARLIKGILTIDLPGDEVPYFLITASGITCRGRRARWRVQTALGGRAIIDGLKGFVVVEDGRGKKALLHSGERAEADRRGLYASLLTPTDNDLRRAQFHDMMRREIAFDLTREETKAAVVSETMLNELRAGKALMDVSGARVRVEQYVLRPAPNQCEFVTLNNRSGTRSYFFYRGTFNANLPSDLNVAFSQLPGTMDTPPSFYLTAFEEGYSNGRDSIRAAGQGGHPVDVNSNTNPNDDVTLLYNGTNETLMNAIGHSVYLTLFDRYGFYINGTLKNGWIGVNIQSYSDAAPVTNNDPLTGTPLTIALLASTVNTTFADPNSVHQTIYRSYSDGTFWQQDNYALNNNGGVPSFGEFSAGQSGSSYGLGLLNYNYESVITASEFSGRKIDILSGGAKVIVQTGWSP